MIFFFGTCHSSSRLGCIDKSRIRVGCVTAWLVLISQAAGPPKKGKPAAAAGGKSKKASDTKEVAETELAVSQTCE